MNFLSPLFLVGAAAIALPIVFHLIRRTSREKLPFSSLMFLLPTPPRVTRRSRLENILLLILRCVVLALLALGFARPFFQQAISNNQANGPGRKIVVLVDASASMKRGTLWADARAKAEEVFRKTTPADEVAVFTFDRAVNRLVNFDQWTAMSAGERAALAVERLAQAAPTWADTHLGNALVTAAEALDETGAKDKQTDDARRRQIVLISDLQEGSRLDALQAYEWPKNIELLIEPVKTKRPTNAGLQLVADTDDSDKKTAAIRVRVSNSGDAAREQFQLGWTRAGEKGFVGAVVDVYVPPGQSRVVPAPATPAGAVADRLALQGDDEDFDNTVFVIAPEAARVNILYLGNDSEKDTAQPLFFLQRAFQQTRRQVVQVIARPGDAPLAPGEIESAPLVIAADTLSEDRIKMLRRLMNDGKTVLFAMKSAAAAPTLAALLNLGTVSAEEAASTGYAMLGEIDFKHPLFAPFADPRFSDFTKIHFWKHRRLDAAQLPGARVLARFDDGSAAFLEVPVGKGALLVLTSGWHPADSQLALSTKFVPLLYSILERSGGAVTPPAQYLVGESVALAALGANTNQPATIRKPDGTSVELPGGEMKFSGTDQPGIYTVTSLQPPKQFAVNLAAEESKTAPLPTEELERLGAPLKHQVRSVTRPVEEKQRLLNTELESRQKLWRWLMLAALIFLLAETWLAGRLTRGPAVEAQT